MRHISCALPLYRYLRSRAYCRSRELSVPAKIAAAIGMAAVTGLLAMVRVPLPFTPVPVTGQTLAVLLAGVLLGGGCGGLSQVIYVALGTAGISWFTLGSSGLLGPTAGYLVGFVLVAAALGYICDRFPHMRRFAPLVLLMLAASATILALGTVYLALYLGTGLGAAFLMGAAPFIAGDALKSLLAAGLAAALLPKE